MTYLNLMKTFFLTRKTNPMKCKVIDNIRDPGGAGQNLYNRYNSPEMDLTIGVVFTFLEDSNMPQVAGSNFV